MPTAPTPLQAKASRRNGARSHGPTTDAGKAASSRNATRHGIVASILLLEPTEQAFLADLRAALQVLHEPWDAAEMAVVHTLALLEDRRRRLDALEVRVLSGIADPTLAHDRLPSLATVLRYRHRLAAEEAAAHERIALLRSYRNLLVRAIERDLPTPCPFDTHEPEMAQPAEFAEAGDALATNEPGLASAAECGSMTEAVPHVAATDAPEPARVPPSAMGVGGAAATGPEQPLNRAARRRQEALARKGWRLAA